MGCFSSQTSGARYLSRSPENEIDLKRQYNRTKINQKGQMQLAQVKQLGKFPGDEVFLKEKDRRTKISAEQLSLFPFNSIGLIESRVKFPKLGQGLPNTHATGFLISSNLVLTSSHNFVIRDEWNGEVEEYVPISFTLFQPNNKKGNLVQKMSLIENVKINMQFVGILNSVVVLKKMFYSANDQKTKLQYYNQILALESKLIQHDFVLIKLSKPIQRLQYFELFPNLKDQITLAVTGYVNIYGSQFRLLTHSNKLSQVCDGGMFYDIDTSAGQSGAPVYALEDNQRVVGIHKAYWPQKHLNFATMITQSIINILNIWAEEMSASFANIQKKPYNKQQSKTPVQNKQCLSDSFVSQENNVQQIKQFVREEDQKNIQSESQNTVEKANQFHSKGNQYFNQKQFNLSLQYFRRALRIKEKVKGKESYEYAKTLHAIGDVYRKQRKLDQALEYLRKVLSIKEKIKGKESLKCASCIYSIGNIYYDQGKRNLAFEYYKRAQKIYQSGKSKESLDLADTLHGIGNLYRKQHKTSEALENYYRAVNIYQNIKGKQSYECAGTFNNIGLAYKDQGELKQALQYYFRALNIKEKAKGKDSFECVSILKNIGDVYQRQNKLNQALEYLNRALIIKERVKGNRSIDCAKTFYSIGLVYQKLNQPVKAMEFFARQKLIKQAHR